MGSVHTPALRLDRLRPKSQSRAKARENPPRRSGFGAAQRFTLLTMPSAFQGWHGKGRPGPAVPRQAHPTAHDQRHRRCP